MKIFAGFFVLISVVLLAWASVLVLSAQEWTQLDLLILAITAGFVGTALSQGAKDE